MKQLNIYGAFLALGGPGTKEDVIIQVAKQQNIRFNDLPMLQKEVDRALEESLRLGFVDRQGTIYKLNMEMPAQAEPTKESNCMLDTVKAGKEKTFELINLTTENKHKGHGDGTRSRSLMRAATSRAKLRNSSCAACGTQDKKISHDKRKNLLENHLMRTDTSFCSICGLNSDKRTVNEGGDGENSSWLNSIV